MFVEAHVPGRSHSWPCQHFSSYTLYVLLLGLGAGCRVMLSMHGSLSTSLAQVGGGV